MSCCLTSVKIVTIMNGQQLQEQVKKMMAREIESLDTKNRWNISWSGYQGNLKRFSHPIWRFSCQKCSRQTQSNFWPLNFDPSTPTCWQSHYTPGRATDTKSIIHSVGAQSQLISVQSGCNCLKHIRRLPEKHFPEDNGSTLPVSHSLTLLLQEHSYKAETDKSDRPIYHIHLFVCIKIPLREYISYDSINTSGYDFIFLACGY